MTSSRFLRTWAAALAIFAGACSDAGQPATGTAGTTASGGSSATGGTTATAGQPATGGDQGAGGESAKGGSSTGGTPSSGGAVAAGGTATGGASVTGGSTTTGGIATGGASSTGGSMAMGGTTATGGSTATGGTTATGGASGDWRTPGNAAVPSPGCGKTGALKSGTTNTITSAGQSRQFIVDIPSDYNKDKPHKLVFGFHWMGGTMTDVATGQTVTKDVWAYFGLKRLDNPRTTIFVAPQGIGNAWPNTDGRDVTFVDDMLKLIEDDLCIDKSRIFSVGFSYGGMMGNTLTCERADVFRAISSHSGAGGCSKTQVPIPFFGAGGTESRDGVKTTARRIAKANGCTDQDPPYPAAGSLSHVCTNFEGCKAGYPVRFCPFDQAHKAAPYDGGCTQCDDGNKTWLPKEDWTFFSQF